MATEKRKTQRAESETTTRNEEQIRARAYELYEERGKEDGHDFDDWIRAEQEVSAPTARKTAA